MLGLWNMVRVSGSASSVWRIEGDNNDGISAGDDGHAGGAAFVGGEDSTGTLPADTRAAVDVRRGSPGYDQDDVLEELGGVLGHLAGSSWVQA